jgi:hypothetical protein
LVKESCSFEDVIERIEALKLEELGSMRGYVMNMEFFVHNVVSVTIQIHDS